MQQPAYHFVVLQYMCYKTASMKLNFLSGKRIVKEILLSQARVASGWCCHLWGLRLILCELMSGDNLLA